MKRAWKRLSAAVAAAALLGGCAFAPVIPPRGLLWTNQKAPLFGGREIGEKEGRASTHTWLFLIGYGDASIKAAAEDAEVSQIKHVDYEFSNFLFIYQRFTTVVNGE